MVANELIPVVGGPLHGTERPFSAAKFLVVPDSSDRLTVMNEDGKTVTLFGEHAYHMTCSIMGGEERYMFRYDGYRKPVCPPNAIEVELQWRG